MQVRAATSMASIGDARAARAARGVAGAAASKGPLGVRHRAHLRPDDAALAARRLCAHAEGARPRSRGDPPRLRPARLGGGRPGRGRGPDGRTRTPPCTVRAGVSLRTSNLGGGRGATPPEGRSLRGHPGAPWGQPTSPSRAACEIHNNCCNLLDQIKQTAITVCSVVDHVLVPANIWLINT